MINETLKADDAERKDAISKAKAVVGFNLKNASGKEESWYLDLKDNGVVGKGAAPEGGKADGEFYALEIYIYVLILDSHPEPLRQRLPEPGFRQGQRPASVHGRQAQDQGQHHEGYQDGACP